jgi:glycosyltransferase involved in cell wall biosynthesis
MRVLHVTPYFAPAFGYGGPPNSILGLCRALQAEGVDVEVFTTTADGTRELRPSPPEGDRYAGVLVRYFPLATPRRMFQAQGLGAALAAAAARADLIHIHGLWTLPAWTAARIARRLDIPYVISPRGMLDAGSLAHHAARKRIAYWTVERRNLAGAAFLHATSAVEAKALEARGAGAPVITLPNGVEAPAAGPPARGAFRGRLGIPPGAPLVMYLGRIHPIKRLDLLAAVFERLREARPDAQLVIAGADEAGYRRALEPHFARSGPSVHWTGALGEAEKWALLADADALVLCSDSESFGMSIVEAMAAGLPVVITQTCPWEEVETARAGFWVPQDAEAIADGLQEILAQPAKAREMGERGRWLVRSRYAWDTVAAVMTERYRVAASGRRYSVLTPGMSGADGISVLSRLIVRALGPVRVLSLLDGGRGRRMGKLRFIARALRATLSSRPPTDIICVHLHLSPLAELMLGWRSRLTTVLVGIEAWRPLRWLERMAIRRSHALVAISEHTARRFREANPEFAARRIDTCQLAVRDEVSPEGSGEANDIPAAFALIVGRMAAEERYKGHDLLIDLWPRVTAEVPGARLVIAGEGTDRARLETKAAPLEDGVSFLGRVSDETLAALYRRCAFFVMPSRDEGFGLVFLEAMRAAKACIGGVGAAAEIIEDGVTGLVVDPADPEQVLKAVLRLYREPETRERMGRAGASRVAARFTEAHFSRRFLALLRERERVE